MKDSGAEGNSLKALVQVLLENMEERVEHHWVVQMSRKGPPEVSLMGP